MTFIDELTRTNQITVREDDEITTYTKKSKDSWHIVTRCGKRITDEILDVPTSTVEQTLKIALHLGLKVKKVK
jgi:hypothetical protein